MGNVDWNLISQRLLADASLLADAWPQHNTRFDISHPVYRKSRRETLAA